MRLPRLPRTAIVPLVAVAIVVLAPLATGNGTTPGSAAAVDQRIVDATSLYVRSHSAFTDFEVQVDKVDGPYARAIVTGADGLDSAAVYLKMVGDDWVALTIGTAFPPDTLVRYGIPASLTDP